MINRIILRAAIIAIFMAAMPGTRSVYAEREGSFKGNWIASGTYQPLDYLEGREVATFRIAGHVNLKTAVGEVADFWSECAGLWDSATGGSTRCVWRNIDGTAKAYSVMEGKVLEKSIQLEGRFIGGSGDLQDLSGELSFTWTTVFRNPTQKIITGHTESLAGSYRLP